MSDQVWMFKSVEGYYGKDPNDKGNPISPKYKTFEEAAAVRDYYKERYLQNFYGLVHFTSVAVLDVSGELDPDATTNNTRENKMASIKNGNTVRVGSNKTIPIRYQGRSGVVVGKAQNARGTQQLLVAFPGRRSAPLAVNVKFATAL